ncbi:MAG: alpha/beta fold hydrolase [Pelolinea sp.]|nr:alpha/beta fold hydrolase [Pelolinea sp.]
MDKTIPIFEHPELDGNSFYLEGNQIGILLIHGFTATTVEVRWLADYLHNKGLTVSAPLLPGHSTTPHDLNKKKYTDWLDCVEEAYLSLRKSCNTIIVGGESMGAVLSLYLAEKFSEIKALLLYSPAIKVSSLKYAKFLRFFKPIIQKRNYDDVMPWQGYTVYPLFAANEFLLLQKLVIQNLSQVNQPVLIFHGAYDRTIDLDNRDVIYSSVNSSIKIKQIMPDSGHVMLLDKEFNLIAGQTFDFINGLKIL